MQMKKTISTIYSCYTFDFGMVTHGSKAERFHLDVPHAVVEAALQERHLVRFRVVAEGAVQATLTCERKRNILCMMLQFLGK